MKVTVSLIYILLKLTACQVPSSTVLSPSAPTPVPPTQGGSQITSALTRPADTDRQSLIEKAREDLAQRLGISVDSVTATTVINQDFSEDAFNCRLPKERIAKEESPSVVSGQSIILVASGRRYEYHANGVIVLFCRPLR